MSAENLTPPDAMLPPFRCPEDLPSNLSPEQMERAQKISEKMITHFNLDPRDVDFITIESDTGERQTAVMYTGGCGLYRGSVNQIYDELFGKKLMLDMDNERVDTRRMTRALYGAFIARAVKSGRPLPDSRQRAEEEGHWQTRTLLTGEKTNGTYALFAFIGEDGSIKTDEHDVNDRSVQLCFRPVVWL